MLVSVENVSLRYPVYDAASQSFRHRLVKHATGGRLNVEGSRVKVDALREISFAMQEGDRVALMGANGAGKSTLLRVLAGVYPPSEGRVNVSGRVSTMFDISLGMDSEATGWENIKLCGLLWGLSLNECEQHAESIAEFSELGEYLAMPIRTYSAGMRLRLAFAIATTRVPDVFLVDEVIGVGDSAFFQKANARLSEMASSARGLMIALHSEEAQRRICNKGLWIDHGRLMAYGPFEEVAEQYRGHVGNGTVG